MRDADLRREYHRLCKKTPGTLVDTEACFRAFKAGVESNVTQPERSLDETLTTLMLQAEQRGEWEG